MNSSSTTPYGQGCHLDLHFATDLQNSHRLTVEIIQPFLPFTLSVALLVKPTSPAVAKSLGLPHQFIAKINDRRFVGSQFNPAVHASLHVALEKIKAGLPCGNPFPELGPTDEDPDGPFEDWMRDIRGLLLMRNSLRRETEAYRQLGPLQGTDIPTFYHRFYLPTPHNVSSSPLSTSPPTANTKSLTPLLFDYVEGMALEYIDGWNMESIKPGIEMSQATIERASEEVLQVVNRVRKHGVAHNDTRLANIILRREYPHKSALIDFGSASLRPESCTPEEWHKSLIGFNEVHRTRRTLANAELHVRSPPHPTELIDINPEAILGFHYPNLIIEGMSPTWRSQFVERVEGPGFLLKEGFEWELPRWIVKKGVKACNDERYN